jgi:hypothetical protein
MDAPADDAARDDAGHDDFGGGGSEGRDRKKPKDLHALVVTEGSLRNRRMDYLVTGSTYRFRVAATNSVGTGPFSPWSVEVTVKDDSDGDPAVPYFD